MWFGATWNIIREIRNNLWRFRNDSLGTFLVAALHLCGSFWLASCARKLAAGYVILWLYKRPAWLLSTFSARFVSQPNSQLCNSKWVPRKHRQSLNMFQYWLLSPVVFPCLGCLCHPGALVYAITSCFTSRFCRLACPCQCRGLALAPVGFSCPATPSLTHCFAPAILGPCPCMVSSSDTLLRVCPCLF